MNTRYTAAHWGTYEAHGFGKDLQLRPVADDPQPSLIGGGWVSAMQDPRARILSPVVRRGWLRHRDTERCSDDEFVSVSWDDALDLVAGEIDRVRTEYGNSAIFAGSYGWASAGRFHHAQSHLRRFLNTVGGFTRSVNTYSHGAAEVLLPHITGMPHRRIQDQTTSWPLVAEHCELLVAFGGVSSRTAQIASSGTSYHETGHWLDRALNNGMKAVLVSPQRSDFADHEGMDWLSIRPGTDTALMLAIAHELIHMQAVDRTFIDRCTAGWPVLEAYITGAEDGVAKTPEWAAAICGIDAAAITDLAAQMARSRTMIATAWGMQRADHGEQPVWMGLALAAMLGQIGQPGTGFAFGYGSVTTVGRAQKLIPWPALPQGKNPVEEFIPVARIADMLERPGEPFRYNGGQYHYPDARLVYWAGGNPFHHHQDLNRLTLAWQRPETVIVQDHSWTATARRADIVLPATSPLERDDIMINRRDPALIWMSRSMDAMGDSRDDYDIFADLAHRLGTGPVFSEGRSSSQWLAWLWDGCGQVAREHGFDLPTLSEFQAAGRFDCPGSVETRLLFDEFVADPKHNPLETASGKIEIFSSVIAGMDIDGLAGHPRWMVPGEHAGNAAPGALHLISPQPASRLHSQLDNGSVTRQAKIAGREPCYMHPATAAERGIGDGDLVCLENSRGACLAGAVLTEDIRADTVALATGSFLDIRMIDGRRIEINGNPNVLTRDKGTSEMSQGNTAHTTMVHLSRFEGTAPPATTMHAPVVVPN